MNCFEILMIVYFVVGTIAELVVFNPFFKNEEELTDSEIVEFQLMIWGWPVLAVLGIIFGILYFGLVVILKMLDMVFPEEIT